MCWKGSGWLIEGLEGVGADRVLTLNFLKILQYSLPNLPYFIPSITPYLSYLQLV